MNAPTFFIIPAGVIVPEERRKRNLANAQWPAANYTHPELLYQVERVVSESDAIVRRGARADGRASS